MHHQAGSDHIERGIGKRQSLDYANPEIDIQSLTMAFSPGNGDHLRRGINADGFPGSPNPSALQGWSRACATAYIEHTSPGLIKARSTVIVRKRLDWPKVRKFVTKS